MKRRRPRRPITFRFTPDDSGSFTARNTMLGRNIAAIKLSWFGVWPMEVAQVVQLMKAGTVDAAEEVYMHVEHRGVVVDFALGGRS